MPKKREEGKIKYNLTVEMEEFLKANPKAGEALKQFGISHERYQMLITSLSRPVLYTANSTNASGPYGELD